MRSWYNYADLGFDNMKKMPECHWEAIDEGLFPTLGFYLIK
jgi:hypothetical protein